MLRIFCIRNLYNWEINDIAYSKYALLLLIDKTLKRLYFLPQASTGANIFGALKGAVDGGLAIPHSQKRFFGFDTENDSLDAGAHRDRIFGVHVANYMRQLADDDDEAYRRQFSAYIKNGVTADSIEAMYKVRLKLFSKCRMWDES